MRRNRYAATCEVCRCQVKPDQGQVFRRPGGWGVCHDQCFQKTPAAKDGPSTILQIEAPHFTVGVLVRDGRVVEAAPIVGYMHNWSRDRVDDYCSKKSWSLTEVGQ